MIFFIYYYNLSVFGSQEDIFSNFSNPLIRYRSTEFLTIDGCTLICKDPLSVFFVAIDIVNFTAFQTFLTYTYQFDIEYICIICA